MGKVPVIRNVFCMVLEFHFIKILYCSKCWNVLYLFILTVSYLIWFWACKSFFTEVTLLPKWSPPKRWHLKQNLSSLILIWTKTTPSVKKTSVSYFINYFMTISNYLKSETEWYYLRVWPYLFYSQTTNWTESQFLIALHLT
jgi:hypothetical protein